MSTETEAEVCRACHGPSTVQSDENVPLCDGHWNSWLAKYDPMYGDLPPCGAHLIRAAVAAATGGGE